MNGTRHLPFASRAGCKRAELDLNAHGPCEGRLDGARCDARKEMDLPGRLGGAGRLGAHMMAGGWADVLRGKERQAYDSDLVARGARAGIGGGGLTLSISGWSAHSTDAINSNCLCWRPTVSAKSSRT